MSDRDHVRGQLYQTELSIVELKTKLQLLQKRQTQLKSWLSSRIHTSRKQRIEKSLRIYQEYKAHSDEANRVSVINWVMDARQQKFLRVLKQNSRLSASERKSCKVARYRSTSLPHIETMRISRRAKAEEFKKHVDIVCRAVLSDPQQHLYYSLVRQRRWNINRMSNEELQLELEWHNKNAYQPIKRNDNNYVLDGPNAIYLGNKFQIAWKQCIRVFLKEPLQDVRWTPILDIVIAYYYE